MDNLEKNNNISEYNTGNWNTDHLNTGDFNLTNGSNGCFNTIEPTISFFNQPSGWTLSQWRNSAARAVMHRLCAYPVRWVALYDMTEAEKENNPECKTTGGYLKPLSQEEQTMRTVENWKYLSDKEKRVVMSIPNFDKEIFKQITGIDVDS